MFKRIDLTSCDQKEIFDFYTQIRFMGACNFLHIPNNNKICFMYDYDWNFLSDRLHSFYCKRFPISVSDCKYDNISDCITAEMMHERYQQLKKQMYESKCKK
jgi:hypothetical protein